MSRYKAGIMKPGFNPLAAVGALYAWGYNTYGQLGQNDVVNRSSPVIIGSVGSWSFVSAFSSHTLAIKTDGTLWAWGFNAYGQLGQNTVIYRSSPTQVGGTTWSYVSGGLYHTAAIKTDGTLWTWGRNYYGQLGLLTAYVDSYTPLDVSSPTQVGALSTWSSVSAGALAMAAIKTDGTLWTWGYNGNGVLGQNNLTYRSSPVQIGALTNWLFITSNQSSSMYAIKTDGTLWAWGGDTSGLLGLNSNGVSRSSPVQVGSGTTWSSVSGSGGSAAAIKTDGTLWTWGGNVTGALGQNNVVVRSSPTQVGALTNWSKVSCNGGGGHMLAIKTDGTLWTWGENIQGQLGQNNVTYRSSPVQVGTLNTWTLVEASAGSFSLASI